MHPGQKTGKCAKTIPKIAPFENAILFSFFFFFSWLVIKFALRIILIVVTVQHYIRGTLPFLPLPLQLPWHPFQHRVTRQHLSSNYHSKSCNLGLLSCAHNRYSPLKSSISHRRAEYLWSYERATSLPAVGLAGPQLHHSMAILTLLLKKEAARWSLVRNRQRKKKILKVSPLAGERNTQKQIPRARALL